MRVDIVIPVHEQMAFLDECLKSVAKTWNRSFDLRIHVIDSASTEPIEECCKNNADLQIKYTRLQELCGVTTPWQIGLKAAMDGDADVIGIVNSDVVFGFKAIEFAAKRALKTGCAFPLTHQRGKLPENFFDISEAMSAGLDEAPDNACIDTGGYAGWAFFLSRDTVNKVGYFDEQFKLWWSDTDYHWRLRAAKIIPWEVRCCWIHHHESRTIIAIPGGFEMHGWRKQDEINFFKKYPPAK